MIDPDTANRLLQILVLIWTAGNSAALWLRKPGKDAAEAVTTLRAEHDQRLTQHGTRLTEIEAHMQHMPTSAQLKEVDGMVKELNVRTQGIVESMSTLRTTLARIEQYLLSERANDRADRQR